MLHFVGNMLLSILPTNNRLFYRLCKRVVDRHNNDNNGRMETNGELRLIHTFLPTASIVFDVGANVGDWTKSALRLNSGAQFHSFEPSPTTFKALEASRFSSNVTLNNFGLGATATSMKLYMSTNSSGNNSLYDRGAGNNIADLQELVRIETLDTYCEARNIRHIDFMKIDVEGHELSVLQGARNFLEKGQIAVIQFEYGGTYIDARVLLKDVWEFIGSVNKDYHFYKIFPGELRRVPEYHSSLENYQYSNWVIKK